MLNSSPQFYPFPLLFRADVPSEVLKLDRMGGILTHLLSEYEHDRSTTFKTMSEGAVSAIAGFHFGQFNKVIILFNYAVASEFSAAIGGFEQFVRMHFNLNRFS